MYESICRFTISLGVTMFQEFKFRIISEIKVSIIVYLLRVHQRSWAAKYKVVPTASCF
ncbi:hypothetical protein Hanom_Chr17g01542661 [Helianthus anomalus]